MSELNEYRYPSKNRELEGVITAARKLVTGDMGKFKFRVWEIGLGRHREDVMRLERYEIWVTPDPDEPEDSQFHFQLSIIPRVIPDAYPQLVGQLMHTVERYWKDRRAKRVISELSDDELDLLLGFKSRHYFELEDYLSQYTRLELENYGVPTPIAEPKLSVTDKRLPRLASYGLIQVEERGINNIAIVTDEGLYTAYLLYDMKTKPPSESP